MTIAPARPDRHVFQQVAIEVNQMRVTDHIGKLFGHRYVASSSSHRRHLRRLLSV